MSFYQEMTWMGTIYAFVENTLINKRWNNNFSEYVLWLFFLLFWLSETSTDN